jgi:hypothetical protein
MCAANECLSVCIPTPLMPKAFAAVLIARSALLGSTAVPLSVVKTRPADSALERPRTKDVRRAASSFDARPGERCGRGIRDWARPGSSGDRASRGRSSDVRDPDQVGEVLHPDGLVEPQSGDGLRAQHGLSRFSPSSCATVSPGASWTVTKVTVTASHRTMTPEPDPAGDPPDQAPGGARGRPVAHGYGCRLQQRVERSHRDSRPLRPSSVPSGPVPAVDRAGTRAASCVSRGDEGASENKHR